MTSSPFNRLIVHLHNIAPAPLVSQYSSLRHLRDRNLLLLALANLLDQMSISLIIPLLPTYAEQLGASPFLIGLIFAAETLAKAIFSTPFGYFSDKFNRRSLIVTGLGISALSVMALGFVRAPLIFIGLRAVDGVATAMRSPATSAYIGDTFEEAERGSAMGAYRTLGMLGVALGPALGGALAAVKGLALPFIVLGVGTLIGSVLVLVFLETVEVEPEESNEEESPSLLEWSPRELLDVGTVPMGAIAVSVFSSQVGTGAFGPMFAVLLEENLAVGPAYIGSMWSLFGLSMFVFMPMGGVIADKTGRKRSLMAGNLLWGGVVIGLALAASRVIPPMLMFLAGIASAFAGPALGAIQYEVAPDGYEGTMMGIYSSLASAGMAIGPILGGAVVSKFGVVWLFLGMGVLWILDTGTIAIGVRKTTR